MSTLNFKPSLNTSRNKGQISYNIFVPKTRLVKQPDLNPLTYQCHSCFK